MEQIQREVEGTQNISESEETAYMTASGEIDMDIEMKQQIKVNVEQIEYQWK